MPDRVEAVVSGELVTAAVPEPPVVPPCAPPRAVARAESEVEPELPTVEPMVELGCVVAIPAFAAT